jgi:DNA invertase Pin-like site-specific DNA recombinase
MQILMHKKNMIHVYARVPTAAEDESGEVKRMRPAGCQKIFRERIIGTTAEARKGDETMKKLAPSDVVNTPTVDRLSRDTTALLVIAR